MFKRFRKRTPEEKAERKRRWEKRREYRKAAREWEKQFPPLSCHPPYVSPEELEELKQMLEARRRELGIEKEQSASGN